jgi:hypothetical protein
LWFDLVNCQFALHYAFDSEQRVLSYTHLCLALTRRVCVVSQHSLNVSPSLSLSPLHGRMLQNVSDRLKDGGWFIGTIPNANWIVYTPPARVVVLGGGS